MVASLKMNTALEYSTRVVQEGDRRCKKSTLNDLAYLTPLRIPLMNPALVTHLPTEGQFYWFLHVTVLHGLSKTTGTKKKFAAEPLTWRRSYKSNSRTQISMDLGVA